MGKIFVELFEPKSHKKNKERQTKITLCDMTIV